MRLAITGHRPPKVGGYYQPNSISIAIRLALQSYLQAHRPEMVYIGMALGVDQWAAELCVQNNIPFFACIPFNGFESRWPDRSKQQYRRLLDQAADRIVVTPTHEYRAWYLQARNQWMVDRADHLLAVWNGVSEGGTWNCIRYAQQTRKPFTVLDVGPNIWIEARRLEGEFQRQRSEWNRQQILPAEPRNVNLNRDVFPVEVAATWNPPPVQPPQPPPPPTQPQHWARRMVEIRRRRDPHITPPAPQEEVEISEDELRALFSQALRTDIRAREAAQAAQQPEPREKTTEEVKDRFVPGRILELDDD